jgi:endonuclease/exonuclease/phosphatase family metal-dependent hydrolase
MPNPRGQSALPAQPALLALVMLMTLEFLRASGPLLDAVASSGGTIRAAEIAVLVYAAPVLIGVLARALGSVRATLLATLGLVLMRIGVQAQEQPTLIPVAVGAVAGIAAVVALAGHLAAERGGVQVATAVVVGGALEIGVRTAFSTWDPIWRPGLLPWIFTAAECVIAVNLLLTIRRRLQPAATSPAVGVIGVYLALFVLFFGSPAFLASQADIGLSAAAAILLAGSVAAVVVLRYWPPAFGPPAVVVLAGSVAVAYWMTGGVVVPAVVAGLVMAATLLARVLARRPAAWDGLSLAALAAGLGYALPVLAFQVHYDRPLPFDNRWVLVIAAVVLGLIGMRVASERTGSGLASVAAILALLPIPALTAITAPGVPDAAQQGTQVRLMTWNVAYGTDNDGVVDLEAIAKAVEAQRADVAMLEEVNRGWPIGGGTDMAEWLARRLRMDWVWSPAADGQFGNLLLTRLPLKDVETGRLPYVQPPQQRSYVAATLVLDRSRTLRVIGTHLQHRKENTRTRLAQIDKLLAVAGTAKPTVIAGDLNMWPEWEEPQKLRGAGFVSAQDVTGHGGEFTSPVPAADNRVDWIWGTPDITFADFAIRRDVVVSDHFPLVVTVTVPAAVQP